MLILIAHDHITLIIKGRIHTGELYAFANGCNIIICNNIGSDGRLINLPALIREERSIRGIHRKAGRRFGIISKYSRLILEFRIVTKQDTRCFGTAPIGLSIGSGVKIQIGLAVTIGILIVHLREIIEQLRTIRSISLNIRICHTISAIDGRLGLGVQINGGVRSCHQLRMGIVSMVGNHHDVIIQNLCRPNRADNLVAQIHIRIIIGRNSLSTGDILRESHPQNSRSIVIIGLLGGGCRIVNIQEFTVRATVAGFQCQITDIQRHIAVRNEAILLGIQHIKLHTSNIKFFTGMRLIVGHVREISLNQLQDMCHITGRSGTLIIDIIHHIFNIDLIVILKEETWNTVIMIGMGMGHKPGVDDNLFPFPLSGQFPTELHKVCTSLVIPLLNITAVINKQAVIRHTNHHQSAAVAGTGGIILGGGQGAIVTIGGHGKTIHHHNGLGFFTGIANIFETGRIALYNIFSGINNNANLSIEMKIVHRQDIILAR